METPLAPTLPWLSTSMLYWMVSPTSTRPLPLTSLTSVQVFSAVSSEAAPTTTVVGSPKTGVLGSSVTACGTLSARSRPWFEIWVPAMAVLEMRTLKETVDTVLSGTAPAEGSTVPSAVPASSEWTRSPEASGLAPAMSATAAPLSVVLPAT